MTVGRLHDNSGGPMQIVLGSVRGQKVHYEAPPAAPVQKDIDRFLNWFRAPGNTDPPLAHVWLVAIHPFDDGNGRIEHAIAEMAFARSERGARRFSGLIRRE
jgi:Fic family protein